MDNAEKMFAGFRALKAGVIGDFALDCYWDIEEHTGEISEETGKRAKVVKNQRVSPGGCANMTLNLVAAGVGEVSLFGVVGADMAGRELVGQLEKAGANVSGLITQEKEWDTPVWAKPHLNGEEQERIDFGFYRKLSESSRSRLLENIEKALPELDCLILNQQLPHPLLDKDMIAALDRLAVKYPKKIFVADCRRFIDSFSQVALKINDICLVRLDMKLAQEEPVETPDRDYVIEAIGRNFSSYPRPVVVTRGANGAIVYDSGKVTEVMSVLVMGETDTVGAGDTMHAVYSAALATGCDAGQAAQIGNWAAAVTIRKLKQTGTASSAEILNEIENGYLIHCPDLAADIRKARYLDNTEIEIIRDDIPRGRVSHVIFDHDGTVSVLREGWEPIMEKLMVESILGPALETASRTEYERVVEKSRRFIDETTGIQTIVQMQGLVEMVRRMGYVPETQILDEKGYKELYNVMLLEMVNKRLARHLAGELGTGDFTLKGALDFLTTLRGAGLHLCLASGTDVDDVKREAETLGYAGMFDGGIYGSVGDITKFSKKKLIAEMIRDIGLEGPQILVFGDGPVEIREVKKKGGLAVGIASDEVRRYGLNLSKRERLIRAGADIIISDYTQKDALLDYLGIKR